MCSAQYVWISYKNVVNRFKLLYFLYNNKIKELQNTKIHTTVNTIWFMKHVFRWLGLVNWTYLYNITVLLKAWLQQWWFGHDVIGCSFLDQLSNQIDTTSFGAVF